MTKTGDRPPIDPLYARGEMDGDEYERRSNAFLRGTMSLISAVVSLPTPACGG
jgi:hypothetical protein